MTKLLVVPTIANFSAQFGENAINTKLDGGASRFRLDKIGAAHEVQVQFVLTDQGFNYLMAFYRTEIDYGSLPFTIDMKGVDAAALTTYTAHFMGAPSSVYLGGVHQVSATLEVTPLAANESADLALIAAGPGQ
jgi:hypothetical protein